jgi:hypothetical protein
MAAANTSPRSQLVGILASPLRELTGFCLAVDCLALGCNGERIFAIAELVSLYGPVLRRIRCSRPVAGA